MKVINHYICKDDNILLSIKNANNGMSNGYSSSNGNRLNSNNDAIYNSFSAKVKNNKTYYNYAVAKKDELVAAVIAAASKINSTQLKK